MGNFQKYWSQNVGQDFIVLDFFVGGRSCGRLMSPVQETQSMREIRLLGGRLPRKGGELTGMHWELKEPYWVFLCFLCSFNVERLLSFCLFSFSLCIVCSLIYSFWLPLWYSLVALVDLLWLYQAAPSVAFYTIRF